MSPFNLRYFAILIAVTLFTFIAIKLVSKPSGEPLSGSSIESRRPIPADVRVHDASAAEKARAVPNAKPSDDASRTWENHTGCCCGGKG